MSYNPFIPSDVRLMESPDRMPPAPPGYHQADNRDTQPGFLDQGRREASHNSAGSNEFTHQLHYREGLRQYDPYAYSDVGSIRSSQPDTADCESILSVPNTLS